MLKPFLILSALVLIGAFAPPPQAQQTGNAATLVIPVDAANQVNPVKPSAESIARAKKMYAYECAMCHGDDGSGQGDLAKNMKEKMPDFRDPEALKARTDGGLYYIINKGEGEMEGEGARMKPEDTWNMVNYVRSFSHGPAAAVAAQGPS